MVPTRLASTAREKCFRIYFFFTLNLALLLARLLHRRLHLHPGAAAPSCDVEAVMDAAMLQRCTDAAAQRVMSLFCFFASKASTLSYSRVYAAACMSEKDRRWYWQHQPSVFLCIGPIPTFASLQIASANRRTDRKNLKFL